MPLTKRYVLKIMKKKLNYDYCQAAPVLEWMSQKWALVVMLRIEEYEKESIRFSELFRTFPQVSEKVLASTLDYLLQEGLVTRERFEEVPPRGGIFSHTNSQGLLARNQVRHRMGTVTF